jgi:hypothetical protein
MTESSHCFWNVTTLRTQILYNCLPEIWRILLCTYLHPQGGADEVIGLVMASLSLQVMRKVKVWHFVTNVHDHSHFSSIWYVFFVETEASNMNNGTCKIALLTYMLYYFCMFWIVVLNTTQYTHFNGKFHKNELFFYKWLMFLEFFKSRM